MRRVVTSVDQEGRSFVLSDEEIADHGGIWTVGADDAPWAAAIPDEQIFSKVQPARGGAYWAVGGYAPRTRSGGMVEGEPPPPGMDADGFHVTKTIDLIMMLEGTLILELDLDQVELHPGDVVVLQAGRHAWRNPSDAPTRFLDVLIATEK